MASSSILHSNILSPSDVFILALIFAVLFSIYGASLVIYRLFFSPIAGVPGPKLAAATQYYETYYDLFAGGGGNFTRKIKQMHDIYGKIVRINPWEVHIDDPEYFETIYPPSAPHNKLKFFENRFNMPRATFATADHSLHKPRRAALAPFFSARRIQGHAPFIQSLVDRISGRLTREYLGQNKPLILNDVYGCLSGDVITNLAFARSYDLIGTENWESPFTVAEMERQIRELLGGENKEAKLAAYDTVFAELLNSKLPPHEVSQLRLQNEAVSVIGAGFETTRWALTVASYHILANPDVKKRLREELLQAIPDVNEIPSWASLQALPYLSACIEEALRVGYGIVQRSPRSSPYPFTYENYTIPPGHHFSSDAFHMHHHEEIFPESYVYRPERWLGDPKGPDGVKSLARYNVAFGRGSRICLGMSMAYCEIYTTLATLMRRFDLSLFDTGRENVEFYQDFVTPQPKSGSLGVRVLVNS